MTSYASVFIALLGSQWIHVFRQLRKRFEVIFYGPLCSHLFGVSPEEYMIWIVWEMTSGLFPFAVLLVR